MAAMSDYLEQKLLDHVLRNVPMTSPTTVYLALFTDDPNDSGGGPEVTDSAYVRQEITFAAPASEIDGHACALDADVSFPAIADASVTISHLGIYDDETDGNLLFHGEFSSSRTYEVGDEPVVRADAVSVALE